MEEELEIMALPSEETLEFYNKVDKWIIKEHRDRDNKFVFTFSKDVPSEIVDLKYPNIFAFRLSILASKLFS